MRMLADLLPCAALLAARALDWPLPTGALLLLGGAMLRAWSESGGR